MIDLTRYCIIIPAYNAQQTIQPLVNQIITIFPSIKIYVINDGSKDKTNETSGVELVNHNHNLGKGKSIKTGIKKAIADNMRFAICIDADLQHDPVKIPEFIEQQYQYNADLVIGCRDFSIRNMPFFRFLSNTWTSKLISIRTGQEIRDCQCGFRLIKLDSVNFDDFIYSGFQFESEFIIKYLLWNKRVVEVVIPTIYGSEKSSINHIPDTLKFIKLYLHSFLWKKERNK